MSRKLTHLRLSTLQIPGGKVPGKRTGRDKDEERERGKRNSRGDGAETGRS